MVTRSGAPHPSTGSNRVFRELDQETPFGPVIRWLGTETSIIGI